MFNGYYDLGNINGMVPYVGAGIGFAHHRMGDVQGDVGPGRRRVVATTRLLPGR